MKIKNGYIRIKKLKMNKLLPEMILEILLKSTQYEIGNMNLVCKKFNEIIKKNTKILNKRRIMISAGCQNSMVLVSGKVYYWGDNRAGQCNVPKDLSNVKTICLGRNYTLALTDTGVVCWYDDEYKKCNIPKNLSGVKDIAVGSGHFII